MFMHYVNIVKKAVEHRKEYVWIGLKNENCNFWHRRIIQAE